MLRASPGDEKKSCHQGGVAVGKKASRGCAKFLLIAPFAGITAVERRSAGAVERDGLENRCGGNPTQGSNPCFSASKKYGIKSGTIGRLTQRESATFTRWKSQVQILYRPPRVHSRGFLKGFQESPFLFLSIGPSRGGLSSGGPETLVAVSPVRPEGRRRWPGTPSPGWPCI